MSLKTMPRDYPSVKIASRHVIELPADCCPVSHNPRAGSTLTLRYVPKDAVLEVYSLRQTLAKFRGGFSGSPDGRYPAERNMEGMIQLVAQMAADALAVRVRFRAILVLDTGTLILTGYAEPGARCP